VRADRLTINSAVLRWSLGTLTVRVPLGVASDGGVRVWVNGEKVHDVKGGRQIKSDQDVA